MRFLLVMPLISLAVLVVSDSGVSRVTAEDVSIDVGPLYFCAPSFQDSVCETPITSGDTVTWLSTGDFHSITECAAGFTQCPSPGGFDSGLVNQGQFQHAFPDPGVFEYLRQVHPFNMRGRIVVSAATPTPAPTPGPSSSGSGAPTTTPVAQSGNQGDNPAAVPASGGAPAADNGNTVAWIAVIIFGAIISVAGAAATVVTQRYRA